MLEQEAFPRPVRVPHLKSRDRAFWKYKDDFYITDDLELESRDVHALLTEVENRRRLKLEKAHALVSMREQLHTPAKRQAIPQAVKVSVWQRDKGRCVELDSAVCANLHMQQASTSTPSEPSTNGWIRRA